MGLDEHQAQIGFDLMPWAGVWIPDQSCCGAVVGGRFNEGWTAGPRSGGANLASAACDSMHGTGGLGGLVSAHQCLVFDVRIGSTQRHLGNPHQRDDNAAWLRPHFRPPGSRGNAAKCSIHYLYRIQGIYRRRHHPSRYGTEYMYARSFVMASGPQAAAWTRVSSRSPRQPAPRPPQQLRRPPQGSRSG